MGRCAPAKGSGFLGCVLKVTPGPGSVLFPFASADVNSFLLPWDPNRDPVSHRKHF